MMQRVDNPEQDISTTWRKFSEVWAVASRNSLYRILAISVALGARQRAKSSSQAPLYVPGRGDAEEIATANFAEFLFHALWQIAL